MRLCSHPSSDEAYSGSCLDCQPWSDKSIGKRHRAKYYDKYKSLPNLSYQIGTLRAIITEALRKLSLPSPSLTKTQSLTDMVFHPKSRTNKRKKDDSTPAAEPSPSQTKPPPAATPATPPPRPTTPPPAPPPAPVASTPTKATRQVDESSLSPAPNGSIGKKARKRQEALDRAAIAECSRREVSIKVLRGTGPPAEAVGENVTVSQSPKTPQPATDQRSPSPTKPKPGPSKPISAKKSKRRHEKIDLYDEATAAAERKNFLKKIYLDDDLPAETAREACGTAIDSPRSPARKAWATAVESPKAPAVDSPQTLGDAADQQSCSPTTTTSQRADKHMSKKSRRH